MILLSLSRGDKFANTLLTNAGAGRSLTADKARSSVLTSEVLVTGID